MVVSKSVKKYKPFLFFIIRFVLCYSLLVVVYKWFLNQSNSISNQVDAITYGVSKIANDGIGFLGYESSMRLHESEASVILYIEKASVVRVIEGCNAINVILLFIAFIVAFSGGIKQTFLYSIIGSVFVFGLNIIRVIIITIAIYHFPVFEYVLHEILFPLLIYGVVFILWLIWVNKYSNHAK